MKPLLAILIPTTPDRQRLLQRVHGQILYQAKGYNVVVIINTDNGEKTTGSKRNELLDSARMHNATHIAFVDSDDLIGPTYIQRNMEGVNGDYDCVELWGQIYFHGKPGNPFHHSIVHDKWHQDNRYYYRCPNHLSTIKLSLLNDIRFRDITIGEDAHYSLDIQRSGLLKREYPVREITYYYFTGKKDHSIEPELAKQRGIQL